jgi:hypothetical protein
LTDHNHKETASFVVANRGDNKNRSSVFVNNSININNVINWKSVHLQVVQLINMSKRFKKQNDKFISKYIGGRPKSMSNQNEMNGCKSRETTPGLTTARDGYKEYA